jgi:hypothetical protein
MGSLIPRVQGLHRGTQSAPEIRRRQYDDAMPDSAPDFPKGIGAPATRALTGAGYTSLDALAGAPVSELKKLHGMGPKALRILQEALEETGRTLG